MTKYCLLILHPFVIIAEEISSPIKSSSYGVSSIILNYSVFTLEAIIAAQSPLHCHFSITSFHWNAIELCNYCTKVNRVVPPLAGTIEQKGVAQLLQIKEVWLKSTRRCGFSQSPAPHAQEASIIVDTLVSIVDTLVSIIGLPPLQNGRRHISPLI